VEIFRRQPDGWLLAPVPPDGRLELGSIDFTCAVDALYEDVVLPVQADAPAE
jgi:hypothetical protein